MSIASQPRFPLAVLPTPLHEARRLREALGGERKCPRIFIKRDDLTGLAFGGNKARKLEFLVADALRQDATVLVTSGAVQSNHARTTAAAACVAGLKCSLVLTGGGDAPAQGNLLLDRLLGAEIHFISPSVDPLLATGDREAARIAGVMSALRDRGERPYLIPVGGSSAVGACGYVLGTLELISQLASLAVSPRRLYYANGSRGTQAGLVLGAKMYSAPYQVYGIAVSGGEPQKTERALRIVNEAAGILGVTQRVAPDDLVNDPAYMGEAYGVPTPACLDAIRLLAQSEAIFLDPVYTGKAMAGLLDHARSGELSPSDTVVFLHSGGTPALFAHAAELA